MQPSEARIPLKCKLLFVDDEPKICNLLADYFSLKGYELRTVCRGEEALALAGVQIKTATFVLEAPQAHSVSVAGDFNDWDTQSRRLEKDLSGVWQITVPLPPGRYEYQFYVDGYWHNDPHSTQRVRNLFGTDNDVIEVPTGS